ncbi:MAG: OPT/YSL family transporter [Armatimonadetes bacterium]|nr:OPT/YSL family transporter [Armatimonadota bacterium]
MDTSGRVVAEILENFSPGLRADPASLRQRETVTLQGSPETYLVWHKSDTEGGPPGKYLADEQGVPRLLVDPGINGSHRTLPDGTTVTKFDAPKATLMSYIIKGILNHQLPWTLVLLGVMIALVLELAGIPSLAFAVGVYLPLSSSTPIMAGGIVRALVDEGMRRRLQGHELTPEELAAQADSSPGVLMASGYIAGGAIAGIAYAAVAGGMAAVAARMEQASTAINPFFAGPYSDGLSLLPFIALAGLLLLVGSNHRFEDAAPRTG